MGPFNVAEFGPRPGEFVDCRLHRHITILVSTSVIDAPDRASIMPARMMGNTRARAASRFEAASDDRSFPHHR